MHTASNLMIVSCCCFLADQTLPCYVRMRYMVFAASLQFDLSQKVSAMVSHRTSSTATELAALRLAFAYMIKQPAREWAILTDIASCTTMSNVFSNSPAGA